MITKLRAFFNPEQFQGWGKTRKYFEGWYYKVVNAAETDAYAFIPGIAMNENGEKQSFIQVLDGRRKTSWYHKFDAKDFVPSPGKFRISIGDNHFSDKSIELHLPGMKGRLSFSGNIPWPKKWYSPGIMGPYAFVPFMECYHGIVSMDHSIGGQLSIGNEIVDFTGGKGYIEKDWGRSFPSAYLWLQTNHFSEPGISVKVSVAKIPWIGNSFVGFIAGLWLRDRLIQFTTYNKSRLHKSDIGTNKVELVIENENYSLDVIVFRDNATELASPIRGMMDGRIEESMTSKVEVKLTDKKKKQVIFLDTGRNSGLEVAGNIVEIQV